jgi:hypothetical protein
MGDLCDRGWSQLTPRVQLLGESPWVKQQMSAHLLGFVQRQVASREAQRTLHRHV